MLFNSTFFCNLVPLKKHRLRLGILELLVLRIPALRQYFFRCGRNPLRYFRPHRLGGSHRLMCSPLRGLRTSCAFAKFSHGSIASCENFAKPPSRCRQCYQKSCLKQFSKKSKNLIIFTKNKINYVQKILK